ncbi:MAG: universal stress protein [Chthonomonadales bacterium]
MFKKILVCSDGSDRAIKAAGVAAELAKSVNAALTMLSVCQIPEVSEPFPGAPTLSLPAVDRYVRDMHLAVVERTLPIIRNAGVPCDILGEVGDPVSVIAQIAESRDFDLIVMGSRGLNTSQAARLGSVSYGVIERAHCPVLVVR